MPPGLRKFALTAHVTSSVGWLGAVAAFLALSLAGLNSDKLEVMRAAYLAMQMITWAVILPLAGASLVTGVIQSLGSSWGLLRHYWVVAKLVIALVATGLLLLHTQPIQALAAAAGAGTLSADNLRQLRLQLVADAVAALAVLIVATTLSVYKPPGMTSYGRRQERVGGGIDGEARLAVATRWWAYAGWVIGTVLLVLFVLRHLTGGGMRH